MAVSHETEANHATLRLVVDCSRGEIHQSREAGPPERPQPKARRPLAQSRPSTAPQKKNKAVANPVFHPSLPPKPHQHGPGEDFAEKFDRCIRVAAGRVGLWGGVSPPKTPKSYRFLSDAGKKSLPLPAALRGGRAPSLASWVANECFLTLCVLRI